MLILHFGPFILSLFEIKSGVMKLAIQEDTSDMLTCLLYEVESRLTRFISSFMTYNSAILYEVESRLIEIGLV